MSAICMPTADGKFELLIIQLIKQRVNQLIKLARHNKQVTPGRLVELLKLKNLPFVTDNQLAS